jgi:hypothetical protein
MKMRVARRAPPVVFYAVLMRPRLLFAALSLLAGACATRTRVVEPAGEPDHYLALPTDWSVGSGHRYRATWTREAAPGPSLPGGNELAQGLRGEVTGEVVVTVREQTDTGYVLGWEPTLSPSSSPSPGANGVAQAGAALWRYQLGLPLELELDLDDPEAPFVLRNQAQVTRLVRSEFERLAGALGLGAPCEGANAGGYACTLFGSPQGTMSFVEHYVGAFFGCTGLEVDPRQPVTWSAPHPNPAIGEAVPIDYRREVVGFVPGSPSVRTRTVWEPNPDKWSSWMKQEMGKIPGLSEPLVRQIGAMRYSAETDCLMDVHTGWPIVIEHRASGGAEALSGADIKRFERIDPEAAPRR